ncbi:MAG: T9SS type A sorting domain-containing protein [Saprospiraceae bacterium]
MNPKLLWLAMLLVSANLLQAQFVELAPMPQLVTNNAVVAASVNGKPYVYSFCGIDSSKIWSGIHLKAWRLDVEANVWESLPDVPDPNGGKIAAAASLVNGKIYVIGGYRVAQNGGEVSSEKVHVFDPESNNWLPDAAPLPKAIDDQVQVVWRDSLIYVVTGWSNTTNVTNVQIFNPAENNWTTGTSLPNQNDYKVFGASGVIMEDTIYYAGGAKATSNFPATTSFRKGIINPNNPAEITWSMVSKPEAKGYRMAAVSLDGKGVWLGGSDVTYNFNGIAYNGSGGVEPLDRITVFDPKSGNFFQKNGHLPAVMDLRGAAQIAENEFVIAGGMSQGQQVSNKVWHIQLDNLTGVENDRAEKDFYKIYPNPAGNDLTVELPGAFELEMYDANSSLLFYKSGVDNLNFSVVNFAPGIYWIDLVSETGQRVSKKVILN